MTKDNPTTVTLIHSKDTKRMHQYVLAHEDDELVDLFCTIYIHKSMFKGGPVPQKLEAVIRPQ